MLTVLFASHNGAHTLPRMLEAWTRLEAPPGGWKAVAVDNASTDATAEIVDGFRDRLPLTLIHEARRGKSAALNTGLAHVEGDLVVFTDDDVVPRPDWLVRLSEAAEAQPGFAVFAGTIKPLWERPPAPWVLDWVHHGPAYALSDPAWPEGETAAGRVWGPNMAVRRSALDLGIRFDENVGPAAGSYAMGDETLFVMRLVAAGLRCWRCPAAVVRHIVRPHQYDRAWLFERAVRVGRGGARVERVAGAPKVAMLFGVPRYLIRLTAERAAVALWRAPFGGRPAFQARWNFNRRLGELLESRRIHLESRD